MIRRMKTAEGDGTPSPEGREREAALIVTRLLKDAGAGDPRATAELRRSQCNRRAEGELAVVERGSSPRNVPSKRSQK